MKIENNTTYKQTDDLLAVARTACRKVIEYYQNLRTVSKDERVVMLLTHLIDKERQMEEMLSKTLATLSEEVRTTYFQYEPEEVDKLLNQEEWLIQEGVDFDQIIEKSTYYDNVLHAFFNRAVEMASNQAVTAVFQNLKQRQEEKAKDKVRDALALKDL